MCPGRRWQVQKHKRLRSSPCPHTWSTTAFGRGRFHMQRVHHSIDNRRPPRECVRILSLEAAPPENAAGLSAALRGELRPAAGVSGRARRIENRGCADLSGEPPAVRSERHRGRRQRHQHRQRRPGQAHGARDGRAMETPPTYTSLLRAGPCERTQEKPGLRFLHFAHPFQHPQWCPCSPPAVPAVT